MTYEEKLDLIIKGLVEAKKATRSNYYSKLYYTADNGLKNINLGEIHDILLKLQDDEKIITIASIPTALKSAFSQTDDIVNGNKDYFAIDISKEFDNWHSNYLIKQRCKIENLTEANLREISFVLTQMEDQLQLSQMDKFNFSFVSSIHDIQGYDGEDIDDLTNGYIKVLDYLKKIGVIKSYTHGEMSLDAEIILNVNTYYEVLDRIKKIKSSQKIEIAPSVKTMPNTKTVKVSYDLQKGYLEIESKKVKFDKDSFRAKLLEILLKDNKSRKKEWSWDEVIGKIESIEDPDLLKENKKKFYPACDGISKFVAQKIGVNDLLIFNKSTVQINEKYI